MSRTSPGAFPRSILALGFLTVLAACADRSPPGAGGSARGDSAIPLDAEPGLAPDSVMARDTAAVP